MEILSGFANALDPSILIFVLMGVFVGICFGAVPGLDPTTGTALLIPITYAFSPVQALLFLTSLYLGGVFGGSITAILFKVPGSSEAVMTSLDGYPMTQRGEAGKALGIAIMSSSIGGTLAVIVTIVLSTQLAKVALQFGPAEYFALAVLGLSCVSSIGTNSQIKSLIGACVGLLLATVGIDAITGVTRFTFGSKSLLSGIAFVPAIIGLFAASEVFNKVSQKQELEAVENVDTEKVKTKLMSLKEILALKWTILRGSVIGTWIGILPGVGATTASIISYTQEVRFSKHPEKFGTGIQEGIAAPEAANNAAAVAAMIPLLSLGIPGSGTTAVLIGAFLIHGLKVGPLLFINNSDLVYSIFGGMFIANFVVVLGGLFAVRFFVKLVKIPYPIMATSIMSFCIIGSLALGDVNGVLLMFVFAVVGFFMGHYKYPTTPVILGLVLGPILETSLRRALMMTEYNFIDLLTRPITAVLLGLALISLLAPWIGKLISFAKDKTSNFPGH